MRRTNTKFDGLVSGGRLPEEIGNAMGKTSRPAPWGDAADLADALHALITKDFGRHGIFDGTCQSDGV
jgi:hypothetical protein